MFLAFTGPDVQHNHNSSPEVSVLGHMNPPYSFNAYIFMIHSNIILQFMNSSSEVLGLTLCYVSQFL